MTGAGASGEKSLTRGPGCQRHWGSGRAGSAEGAAPTGGAGRSGTESARDVAERREGASETWRWRAGAAGLLTCGASSSAEESGAARNAGRRGVTLTHGLASSAPGENGDVRVVEAGLRNGEELAACWA